MLFFSRAWKESSKELYSRSQQLLQVVFLVDAVQFINVLGILAQLLARIFFTEQGHLVWTGLAEQLVNPSLNYCTLSQSSPKLLHRKYGHSHTHSRTRRKKNRKSLDFSVFYQKRILLFFCASAVKARLEHDANTVSTLSSTGCSSFS